MNQMQMLEVFGLEAERLSGVLAELSEAEWDRPTRCAPWRVRDLVAHVRITITRLPGMLAAPAPDHAQVDAAGYYRPDDRFAPEANAARVSLAHGFATDQASGSALADDFAAAWREVFDLCRAEPEGRVVRTRHGDAMALSEFLLTRVVEVALHGVDVADALGREPWLTDRAGAAVQDLLLGPDQGDVFERTGWDRLNFLRKATGREPLDDAETAQIERLAIRWLTLG